MPKIFGVIKNISLMGYVFRTFIVGIIMFTVARFIAKRAFGQISAYDFVFAWILGALTVAPLLDGKISFTYTIVPLATLFFWHTVIGTLSKYNSNAANFFNGRPVLIINKGKIIRKNLERHFINSELLLSQLRLKDVFNIADIEYAVLEPSGQISVMKKKSVEAIYPQDISLTASPNSMPIIVIKDGKLLRENMKKIGIDEKWLRSNLSVYNIKDFVEVHLALIDDKKNLYVSKNK